MPDLQSTHAIEIHGDVVTKRYADADAGAAAREWRALNLLAEHAPGLAPVPLGFDGEAITMSRLDGVPVRGMATRPAEELAKALSALHAVVPPADLPVRPWHAEQLKAQVLEWCTAWHPRDPLADLAVAEGARWLESWRPREPAPPAFGAGDGNLANFLWDGERVRILDFEDSGRSDRVFELAEVSEHVASWVDGEVNILPYCELSETEERRLRECRRLQALTWLFLLSGEGPRNPPGTFARQVRRVLERLEA
ncbi:phosphotransferase family protein [Nonomuraea sp. NPDC050536]|uniref:phosphotransferase family protein n=1 Tax=Nonomuraea sp. NPDC050536 TaxID=3364366 RepID=UPI0037C76268